MEAPNSTVDVAAGRVDAATAPYIVFYDGVCVLCHTGMRQLMGLDRENVLHYAQLQGETARSFGIEWEDDGKPGGQTFVFIDNSGPEPIVYERMRAVRAELEVIGRLPVLTFLLRVIPLPITNALYRMIAATRYRLWGAYDNGATGAAGTRGLVPRLLRRGSEPGACPLPPRRARDRMLP